MKSFITRCAKFVSEHRAVTVGVIIFGLMTYYVFSVESPTTSASTATYPLWDTALQVCYDGWDWFISHLIKDGRFDGRLVFLCVVTLFLPIHLFMTRKRKPFTDKQKGFDNRWKESWAVPVGFIVAHYGWAIADLAGYVHTFTLWCLTWKYIAFWVVLSTLAWFFTSDTEWKDRWSWKVLAFFAVILAIHIVWFPNYPLEPLWSRGRSNSSERSVECNTMTQPNQVVIKDCRTFQYLILPEGAVSPPYNTRVTKFRRWETIKGTGYFIIWNGKKETTFWMKAGLEGKGFTEKGNFQFRGPAGGVTIMMKTR